MKTDLVLIDLYSTMIIKTGKIKEYFNTFGILNNKKFEYNCGLSLSENMKNNLNADINEGEILSNDDNNWSNNTINNQNNSSFPFKFDTSFNNYNYEKLKEGREVVFYYITNCDLEKMFINFILKNLLKDDTIDIRFNNNFVKDINVSLYNNIYNTAVVDNINIDSDNYYFIPFNNIFVLLSERKVKYDGIIRNNCHKYLGNISLLNQLLNKIIINNKIIQSKSTEEIIYVSYLIGVSKTNKLVNNKQMLMDNYPIIYYSDNLVNNNNKNITPKLLIHKILDYNNKETNPKQIDYYSKLLELIDNYKKINNKLVLLDQINLDDFVNRSACLNNFITNSNYKPEINGRLIKIPKSIKLLNNNNFEEINAKIIETGINYPFLIKTEISISAFNAHQIGFVMNEKGLKDILNNDNYLNYDILIQEFVIHEGFLYKYYNFISDYYIYIQDSLYIDINSLTQNYYIFHSHSEFKKLFDSGLAKPSNENIMGRISKEFSDELVDSVIKIFDNYLFGFDIVHKSNSNEFYFVDYNYFPDYTGMDNMDIILEKYILNKFKNN